MVEGWGPKIEELLHSIHKTQLEQGAEIKGLVMREDRRDIEDARWKDRNEERLRSLEESARAREQRVATIEARHSAEKEALRGELQEHSRKSGKTRALSLGGASAAIAALVLEIIQRLAT